MGDEVNAWTEEEMAAHKAWAWRFPRSQDARWLATVRQRDAEIARLRATPGGRLVEAARPVVGARRASVECDAAIDSLESALAALPEGDAGKAITAPELTRIASTLTDADDLPDIGRANTMLSGPDAEKDVRAVLAEAKAALDACAGRDMGARSLNERARAAAKAIGEVLTSRPPVIGVDTCRRCGKSERPSYEHDRSIVCAGCHVELKLTELDAQLAREREAVDGLIAILEDDDRDCDAWKLVLASIEAVRKSREGAGSSPPDERLGWAAEIRARASPCLELRGLELHDSSEQTVGPRVVALPDCEGWWILRAESGPAEHVAVERELMEIRRNVDTDKLVVWNGGDWYALTEIDPSDRERWVGPLPEGWT